MSQPPTEATELQHTDIVGPSDGRPIVFVHGAMFTRAMWAPQRDALADEFRVIVPDLPGHGGRSSEPFDFERSLTILETLLEKETDGKAVLVGLSLGGYLVTEYASRHPEQVDGLVVIGASANPVRGMNLLTRLTGGVARLVTRSDRLEGLIERLGYRWVKNRDLSPATKAEIIDAGLYPRSFGTPGPALAGRNFRAMLASYPGPTLLINGENDAIMRRGASDHAEAGIDVTTVVVSGVGHVCTLHAPEAVTDVIREFVSELDDSGS